jgi:hypothetical protein
MNIAFVLLKRLKKKGAGLKLTDEVKWFSLPYKGRGNVYARRQFVRIADSIAYINHDIDDALERGFN